VVGPLTVAGREGIVCGRRGQNPSAIATRLPIVCLFNSSGAQAMLDHGAGTYRQHYNAPPGPIVVIGGPNPHSGDEFDGSIKCGEKHRPTHHWREHVDRSNPHKKTSGSQTHEITTPFAASRRPSPRDTRPHARSKLAGCVWSSFPVSTQTSREPPKKKNPPREQKKKKCFSARHRSCNCGRASDNDSAIPAVKQCSEPVFRGY